MHVHNSDVKSGTKPQHYQKFLVPLNFAVIALNRGPAIVFNRSKEMR